MLLEYPATQQEVKIKGYHTDNGIFDSDEFTDAVKKCRQIIDFSGTGAHHQNGIAEHGTCMTVEWSHTMLLHAAIHWPEQADLALWPYALDYTVYLWNNMPKKDLLVSPAEIFSKMRYSQADLQCKHIWGCPVYILDPTLQDGNKLPKWQPWS